MPTGEPVGQRTIPTCPPDHNDGGSTFHTVKPAAQHIGVADERAHKPVGPSAVWVRDASLAGNKHHDCRKTHNRGPDPAKDYDRPA